MIQFNLLPDVKIEYIKARRTKRLVTVISIIVAATSVVVFLLAIVTVDVVQKKSLHDLDTDITKYSKQLKSTPNLDKILTVQNQLETLGGLHADKPVTSRLFGYIAQLTPTQASLGKLSVDFTANTMIIGGTAPSLDVVSTYTDTLKATTYTTDADTKTKTKAFSSVVLSSFGRDSKNASFTIMLSFDPVIFNSKNNVKLTLPTGATNSQSALFGATN
jgi:Tfp pilus assembly protein PilN